MSVPEVRVEVMVTGRVPTPRAYVFRPSSGNRLAHLAAVLRAEETVDSPCLAYVLRHPTAGAILVDTGFHPDATQSLRKDLGTAMALLFRNLRPSPEGYLEQLGTLGVQAADVGRVVMTHLHVDHTSGMRLLPGARFTCSRDEWRAATRRGAVREGYVAAHLPPAQRMDLVDFAAQAEPHGPFPATVDLLGDGSIRLISTPGHTRGHLSVLVHMAGGRDALLIGDAVYTLESLRTGILPLLTADDVLYRASLRELAAFAAERPDAILVPTHDPTAWQALAS